MNDGEKLKLVVSGGKSSMNKLTKQERIEKAKKAGNVFVKNLTDEKRKIISLRMGESAKNQSNNMTCEERIKRAKNAANKRWSKIA